jgi:hypothetical protein
MNMTFREEPTVTVNLRTKESRDEIAKRVDIHFQELIEWGHLKLWDVTQKETKADYYGSYMRSVLGESIRRILEDLKGLSPQNAASLGVQCTCYVIDQISDFDKTLTVKEINEINAHLTGFFA